MPGFTARSVYIGQVHGLVVKLPINGAEALSVLRGFNFTSAALSTINGSAQPSCPLHLGKMTCPSARGGPSRASCGSNQNPFLAPEISRMSPPLPRGLLSLRPCSRRIKAVSKMAVRRAPTFGLCPGLSFEEGEARPLPNLRRQRSTANPWAPHRSTRPLVVTATSPGFRSLSTFGPQLGTGNGSARYQKRLWRYVGGCALKTKSSPFLDTLSHHLGTATIVVDACRGVTV